MSGLKKIRNRIRSVKNTGQISQAMKMISVARLKKAQNRILGLRSYAEHLRNLISDLAFCSTVKHPLLEKKQEMRRVLLVVLTSDRGLCGGFNNNICRYAEQFYLETQGEQELEFYFIGKKGKSYFQFRKIEPSHSMTQLDKEISYALAEKVTFDLLESFYKGEYDGIYFIYNHFQSAMLQKVVKETFLPIEISEAPVKKLESFSKEFLYDEAPDVILESLIRKHFSIQVYRCMCESVAAEHGARMTAMENATKNAKDMTNKLSLTFNRLRQDSITTELIEVSSGVEALKA